MNQPLTYAPATLTPTAPDPRRYWVLATLFGATFLNYFDRQTLGTAIGPIADEFGLTNPQRAELLAAFTLTYALTHLLVGAVIDRLRSLRWFFALMVLGWSVSTGLVGLARNYEQLLWLRYGLGVWEAVNFPICLLIIARLFPAEERSLAAGVFASGAFLATLAAPPVVIYFSNHYNWRYSFGMAGMLGFAWLVPWLLIYRNIQPINAPTATKPFSWPDLVSLYRQVLRQPGFWGVALIGLGIVPSLYFATQWFPTFFTQALNQPLDGRLSAKLSLIYVMQDAGLWLGGALVLMLARRGRSILSARKAVMTLAFGLMMAVLLVPLAGSVAVSVALLAVYVTGIGIFLGNQHAFKQDVLATNVGTVVALVGFIETGFTFLVLRRIGTLTANSGDFTPVFWLLAGLAGFALLVVYGFMRPRYFKQLT